MYSQRCHSDRVGVLALTDYQRVVHSANQPAPSSVFASVKRLQNMQMSKATFHITRAFCNILAHQIRVSSLVIHLRNFYSKYPLPTHHHVMSNPSILRSL